jgi:hypothetical protein
VNPKDEALIALARARQTVDSDAPMTEYERHMLRAALEYVSAKVAQLTVPRPRKGGPSDMTDEEAEASIPMEGGGNR